MCVRHCDCWDLGYECCNCGFHPEDTDTSWTIPDDHDNDDDDYDDDGDY